MNIERATTGDSVSAGLVMNPTLVEAVQAPRYTYAVECVGADGQTKWTETVHNLVPRPAKTDLIDKYFKGSTYTAAWYMGLKSAGTPAVTDTLASHVSWTESNPYSGNRPAITFGSTIATSDVVTNTATAVSYAITGSATVAGAFVASANSGTSGVLYSASDFAAARTVSSGDTLNVTLTVSMS